MQHDEYDAFLAQFEIWHFSVEPGPEVHAEETDDELHREAMQRAFEMRD